MVKIPTGAYSSAVGYAGVDVPVDNVDIMLAVCQSCLPLVL
ncbi:MAG: hypothetical protein ACLS36_02125 [Streptococcus sp.]